LQRCGALVEEDRLRVARGLSACPIAARYPSNNWVLLAATCSLLEAGAGLPRWAATARFARLATRWFTPAGAFIDAPSLPAGRPPGPPPRYPAQALLVRRLPPAGAPAAG